MINILKRILEHVENKGRNESCTEGLVSERLRVLHVEGAMQASFKLSLRVMI